MRIAAAKFQSTSMRPRAGLRARATECLAYRLLVARAAVVAIVSISCGVFAPPRVAADYCSRSDKSCPPPVSAESARGLALGTGMRASAISTSALAYSPGALSLGNLYHIEGNVDYMAQLKTAALGAAVVDSSTSKLGAGLGLRGFLSGDSGYGGIDGRLGLAVSLTDAISVGVGGRYISLSQMNTKLARGFAMDASLRVMPVSGFQLDFAALNFVSNARSPYVPIQLVGGAAVAVLPSLSIGGDLLLDMTTYSKPEITVGGGVEYLAVQTVPLRLGYVGDIARSSHAISAGVGYTDQRIGLDVGLRQQFKGGHETRVMAAIRYYVN
jgi:hypothetical protein